MITREGVIIFYVNELEPSGEIPYPFSESLRKPHMENTEGAKYSLNELEMQHGNNIGVTRRLGRLQDEDVLERKLGEGLDETPPGSDIENNPGEFLKELSPLKGKGVFDFKRPKPIVPSINKDLETKDFSKLTNEELQYMLSLMNEQYIQTIDLSGPGKSLAKKKSKKPDSALRKVYGNIDPFLYSKEDQPDNAAQMHFKKIESSILTDFPVHSFPENKSTRNNTKD